MRRFGLISLLLAASATAQQVSPRLGTFYSLGQVSKGTYATDGSLILGGAFDRVGTTLIRNLVRYHPNGTLDTSWAPNPDGSFIRGLIIDSSGNLYVAGNFRTIAQTPRVGLARFNPGSPYTLDPTYLPQIPSNFTSIDNIALRSDGTMYISYCVAPVCKILRLDNQGNPVAGFDVSTNGLVFPIILTPDESHLLVSGTLTAIDGVTIPSRGNLAKLDANTGALDQNWIPFTTGNGAIRMIVPDGPAHVLVGGTIPGGTEGLARIPLTNPGTADVGFGPDFGPAANITVSELLRAPDGDLVVAGNFTEVDLQPRPARIARLGADGNLRAAWGINAPVGGASSNTAFVSSSGKVALPRFTRPGLARSTLFELSNADGTDLGLLTSNTFSARATLTRLLREPVSGRIFAAGPNLEEIDGRTSTAIFAFQPTLAPDPAWTSMLGSQATIGGSIAVATGSTTLALGGFGFGAESQQVRGLFRLNAVDGSNVNWVPQASSGVNVSTEAVSAVAVDETGGFIYALGILRNSSNQTIPGGPFLRFALSDGIRDATWVPTISFNGTPTLLLSGGFLYVSGINSTLATDNSSVNGLARFALNGTGRADATFKPFSTSTALPAMAEDSSFIYVGGPSTLARVSKTSGLIDVNWRPLLNPTGINSLSVASEGSVYVTGTVNAGCNSASVPVARVHPGGNLDLTWRVAIDGLASASLPLSSNNLLIAGNFSRMNNAAHDGLALVGPSDGLFSDGAGDPRCVTSP